ncbi:MAG: hypothetical protein IJ306_01025 [Oscillospiraceae bacterium]|nr:hypothetical protein [Oscillospiraceae bacterium]
MRKESISDFEVELEIERLRGTEEVRLAQKEIRLKNKRRLYMHQLRCLEKRGKVLMENGVTLDNIEEALFGEIGEEETE